MGIYSLIKRLAFRPRATAIQAAIAPQEQAWQAWLHPEVQVSVQGDRVIVCGEVATQAERNRLLSTVSRLTGGAVQDLIRVGGAGPTVRATDATGHGHSESRLRLVTSNPSRPDSPSLVASTSR
ncbi:MAG: BON domain-containing protein [Pseudomonadota bacterium]